MRRRRRRDNKIRKFDDPILRQVCEPVTNGEEAGRIGSELRGALKWLSNAVGLAAPQIGYARRVIAYRHGGSVFVLVNPVIIESHGSVMGTERCLSYPGVKAEVERPERMRIEYVCANPGEGFKIKRKSIMAIEGDEARVASHEMDHLSGVCRVGDVWREELEHATA